jgi:leucyl-tRNA synthetase
LAPEHEWVAELTTPEQKQDVADYIAQTKKKSELDRMADTKTVSGAFTGTYVINPVSGERVQLWIADYVLAGYGTGAVMGVPSGDQRDWLFATHFNLPIIQILDGQKDIDVQADPTKEGKYINSGFINGMTYKEAVPFLNNWLEEEKVGKAKVNFRQRDAIFGRQRYWGEPIPVYFKDGLPYLVNEEELPLLLPEIDKYLPTETGEPPLARAEDWVPKDGGHYELSTMPGWAGSSWYWYRYMDANNNNDFASKEAVEYWKDVDLYIGGSEHATGHLLYSRFWNKFLKDLGYTKEEEPFKKLINQGMIQGRSNFVYRFGNYGSGSNGEPDGHSILRNIYITHTFVDGFQKIFKKYNKLQSITLQREGFITYGDASVSFAEDESKILNGFKDLLFGLLEKTTTYNVIIYPNTFLALHVDVNIVENDTLDIAKFKGWREEYANAEFILEGGKYICGVEVEKMSKSKFNVVNPDDLIERYGADTLRMYEMFLGPLEQSKPWNTNGIEGVFKFLRKFWRLFHNEEWAFHVNDTVPTKAELKTLHKIIKKVQDDIERFSFNTSVSSFMIAVNELTDLKCKNRQILEDMVIILSPYAPHICEELWVLLDNEAGSLSYTAFPTFKPEYLVEDEFAYPVSINGKMKMNLNLSLTLAQPEVESILLADEHFQKFLDGKAPKKIIFVKGKIINVVV